jgi:hypothetical protein
MEDKGWAIIEQEMPKQFHPDGVRLSKPSVITTTLGFCLQAFLRRRRPIYRRACRTAGESIRVLRRQGQMV